MIKANDTDIVVLAVSVMIIGVWGGGAGGHVPPQFDQKH